VSKVHLQSCAGCLVRLQMSAREGTVSNNSWKIVDEMDIHCKLGEPTIITMNE